MAGMRNVPSVLTIAGSDSGGGAGVQADLKTFAAMGVYGTSAITAITAQNTVAVTAVHEIPVDTISAQIEAVVSDIGVDAVKIGMLSSSAIIECVVESLSNMSRMERLVVDPVMIAKSGDSLLREDAVRTLRDRLLPLAAVVTPNIPEAETLTGMTIVSDEDVRRVAKEIVAMGAGSVVVKGGHRDGAATDVYYDGTNFLDFTAPRFETANTHGTGCTFAAAVAAGLAKGLKTEDAIGGAKEFVTEAIRNSFPIGQGHGPLSHFYRFWAMES